MRLAATANASQDSLQNLQNIAVGGAGDHVEDDINHPTRQKHCILDNKIENAQLARARMDTELLGTLPPIRLGKCVKSQRKDKVLHLLLDWIVDFTYISSSRPTKKASATRS